MAIGKRGDDGDGLGPDIMRLARNDILSRVLCHYAVKIAIHHQHLSG